MHTSIQTHVHVLHIVIYAHTRIRIHMYEHVYVCMYYVCMYACTYICTYYVTSVAVRQLS
jgi:hypothetical protein